MNDMREYNSRDYRDYRDYRDNDYRDEDYRDYRDYRNYRDDYRTRDYDRRGGKINRRNYRNYRDKGYHEELEMVMDDMREQYRKLEDISEMADNQHDKITLMKISQREK